MYIKKKLKEKIYTLNNYVDSYVDSKEFKKFLDNQKEYICLKNKNSCYCSCCKNEFQKKCKINDYIECPICKRKLLVKRTTNYIHKNDFMYLIKYGEKYIIRNYEIVNSYLKSAKKMKFIVTEYARQIINNTGITELRIIINNMRKNLGGYWYINYCEGTEYWKPESFITGYGKCFIDKDTLVAKYYDPKLVFDNAEVNVRDILKGINKNNYVLEILTKAGLYNLAANYFEFKRGKFEDVFKLDKSYLSFMIENNISYNELVVLQKLKIKDYELVKYFAGIYELNELLKYCKPYDLMKYHIRDKDIDMYLDYISMAKAQKMNLDDKKILYPQNLRMRHDALQHQLKIKKDKIITKKINQRYSKIKINEFQDKKYVIYPVKSIEELIDESSQQNNCVKTYAERIAKGKCDIYLMRLVENKNHSLVTVEVKDNKIVQKRSKNNEKVTIDQNKFLNFWENTILKNNKI